jgi:hypothetical protein
MKNSNQNLQRVNALIHESCLHVEKAHQRITDTVVLFEAHSFAVRNMPKPDEVSLTPYTTTIRGAYDCLRKDIILKLQSDIQKNLGDANMATVNQKITYTQERLKEEKDRRNMLTIDKQRIRIDESYHAYQKQKIFLYFLGIGECVWTAMCFIKLGDIVLLAVIFGLALGLAQIILTKNGVQIIKEIENERKRRLYAKVLIGGLIIVSLIIGILRYYFIHAGTGSTIPFLAINPITFTVINLLFISATAAIVFFYPRKEELLKIHKIEQLENEISKSHKRTAVLEQSYAQLLDERNELKELELIIISAGNILSAKVDACYCMGIGHFKHENTIKRPDGRFCLAFKNPHEPLYSPIDTFTPLPHL